MSENTVIAVAPSTTATSKPRPSPVLVASRMGRVTAHKRNGPPQGRAAISGCRHRFVPGRERTVPGTSAGARTYPGQEHMGTQARGLVRSRASSTSSSSWTVSIAVFSAISVSCVGLREPEAPVRPRKGADRARDKRRG